MFCSYSSIQITTIANTFMAHIVIVEVCASQQTIKNIHSFLGQKELIICFQGNCLQKENAR